MLSYRHIGAPLYYYRGRLAPDFGFWGHLWSGNDAISSQLRLTSPSDCFPNSYQTYTKGLRYWHAISEAYGCTHTVPPAKLATDFGILVICGMENDAISSWLRLKSTSDCIPHPYQTYTQCLKYWYAVLQAYGCTLISFHQPSWPQILEFWVTCGVEIMPLCDS